MERSVPLGERWAMEDNVRRFLRDDRGLSQVQITVLMTRYKDVVKHYRNQFANVEECVMALERKEKGRQDG